MCTVIAHSIHIYLKYFIFILFQLKSPSGTHGISAMCNTVDVSFFSQHEERWLKSGIIVWKAGVLVEVNVESCVCVDGRWEGVGVRLINVYAPCGRVFF